MTEKEFILEVNKLNILINDEKLSKLKILYEELIKYNFHTNLTRITSLDDVYLKHYYDSLTICKAIDLNKVNNLIDVGTGAGFPGIVLKIFFPDLSVTLLDSNQKKVEWLKFICDKLGLNVHIIKNRIENYAEENLNSFDIVTSRAVANLRVLSELSLPLVKLNGYFIPLKGSIEKELEDSKNTIELMGGEIIDIVNFDLPDNKGKRSVLKITKKRNSYIKEIRTYDKIVKKPLKKQNI